MKLYSWGKVFDLFRPTRQRKRIRQTNEERVLSLIKNHPCFIELALWKSTKADSMNISDPSKKEMVREYLVIVCDTYENHIENLKRMNVDKMCKNIIETPIAVTVSNILKEANKVAAMSDIPYLFLAKIDTVISRHIEIMADSLSNLQLYRKWDTDEDKVLATLDILYMTIRMIGGDLPNIVNAMNGELKMMLVGSKFDRY